MQDLESLELFNPLFYEELQTIFAFVYVLCRATLTFKNYFFRVCQKALLVKFGQKLYKLVGDVTWFERSENRVYSFLALLFTLFSAKSCTSSLLSNQICNTPTEGLFDAVFGQEPYEFLTK